MPGLPSLLLPKIPFSKDFSYGLRAVLLRFVQFLQEGHRRVH